MYHSPRPKPGWFIALFRQASCVFLFLVPAIFITFSFVMLVFIGWNSYPAVLKWYGSLQPEGFDLPTIAANCFTPRHFRMVTDFRWAIIAVLAAGGGCYLLFSRRIWAFVQQLVDEIGAVFNSMAAVFQEMTRQQRMAVWLLFTGIGIYRLYFYFAFPMHPDEVCSYLFFARQGVLVTTTNYVLPNNHILLNLLCAILNKVVSLPPKAIMRLPSMIGDMILFAGVFCLFSRGHDFKRAFVVVGGTAFCYYTSYYAVQGRGYELQIICALISGLAGWKCFCGPCRHSRKGFGMFVVFSVAGLYLNPTFCYHVTAMGLLCGYCLLKRREKGWTLLIRAMLLIGLWTLLLYLPVLLMGGWGGLVQNSLDPNEGFRGLLHGYRTIPFMIKDITYYGMAGFLFVCLFSALAVYLYRKKRLAGEFYDGSLIYLISLAGSLTLWTLYTRVYPYERTLCFAILGLYILFVNICYDLGRLYAGRVTPWMIGCFLLIKVTGSIRGLYQARYSPGSRYEVVNYRVIGEDLDELDGLHPSSWQVWDSDSFYAMYLRLHLAYHNRKERVMVKRDSVAGDVIFLPGWAKGTYSTRGYRLWKFRALPSGDERYTDSTYIYVADRADLHVPPSSH